MAMVFIYRVLKLWKLESFHLRAKKAALKTELSRRKGVKTARVESSKRLDQGWP